MPLEVHMVQYPLSVPFGWRIKEQPILTKQDKTMHQYLISPLKFHTDISLKYLFIHHSCTPMLQQHCEKAPWEVAGWYLKGRVVTWLPVSHV